MEDMSERVRRARALARSSVLDAFAADPNVAGGGFGRHTVRGELTDEPAPVGTPRTRLRRAQPSGRSLGRSSTAAVARGDRRVAGLEQHQDYVAAAGSDVAFDRPEDLVGVWPG
jgi:hypothetical protein